MTIEEILAGESENIEFKRERPADAKKYLKSVVAFANGHGGRIIFGVEDKTLKVTGISDEILFKEMDAIANTISDSCEPRIIPDISLQEIDGKTLIVVEIAPGMQRPYYIKSMGMQEVRRATRYLLMKVRKIKLMPQIKPIRLITQIPVISMIAKMLIAIQIQKTAATAATAAMLIKMLW